MCDPKEASSEFLADRDEPANQKKRAHTNLDEDISGSPGKILRRDRGSPSVHASSAESTESLGSEASTSHENPFSSCYDDIWLHIFQLLRRREGWGIPLTCKHWNSLVKSDKFLGWKPDPYVVHVGTYPHVKALTIAVPYDDCDTLEDVLNRLQRIGSKAETFQIGPEMVGEWIQRGMNSTDHSEQFQSCDAFLLFNLPATVMVQVYNLGSHVWHYVMDKYREEFENRKNKNPQWPWNQPPNFKSLRLCCPHENGKYKFLSKDAKMHSEVVPMMPACCQKQPMLWVSDFTWEECQKLQQELDF